MENNKLKIGFIGLGQCGSNIAEIAELYGYRTAICNTSPEDLEAIQLVKNKILLGTTGGSGKDRRLAKQSAKENYDKIVNLVKDKFDGIDLIYFIFSTGGGTGSGMSPMMIDVVRRLVPDKKFACIAVLPSNMESAVAHINSAHCLKEIVKLNIPSLIADNQKLISANSRIKSRKELFDRINNYVIDSFNLLLNSKRTASKYGNLDQQDIIKLLYTPGCTVITTTSIGKKEKDEQGFSFGKKLMSSWDNSFFAPIEYDKKVTRLGFIYEVNEATTKLVNYDEIKREIGEPIEIFEGFYEPIEDTKETIVSILTGLSYPIARINELIKIAEGSKVSVEDRNYDAVFANMNTDWFDKARETTTLTSLDEEDDYDEFEEVEEAEGSVPISVKKPKTKKKKEANLEDLFASYMD